MDHRPRVVLASTSRTRSRILSAAGVAFETLAPTVDEAAVREALFAEHVATEDAAVALADLKVRSVLAKVDDNCLVLGADQLLEFDGVWLEKPRDNDTCRRQLEGLRGKRHRLVSGVVAYRGSTRSWQHVGVVEIALRDFSSEALDAYMTQADPSVLNSVGGYQFEGLGAQLMATVKGDYFDVLGLPLLPVLQFLRDHRVMIA